MKCKQQKDVCWNLNYVVSGAFNANRKKPAAPCLECVPGSTTQLQVQTNLDEKMCGENLKEHCQRGEQAQFIMFWSVRPSWLQLLSVTFCPVQALSIQKISDLVLSSSSLQQLLHAMLPGEITNCSCILILYDKFPKWISCGFPLILNNIHSQLIHNEIVGCYNAD